MKLTMHGSIHLWALMPLLAACGGAQNTEPESASAAEHRAAADEEEQAAAEHEEQFDPTQVQQEASPSSEVWYGLDIYNPSEIHLAEAERARSLAAQHRAAAEALEAYEEQECAHFPAESRATCPLMGQLESVREVEGGVALELKEGVNDDAVADHMRCHIAFAAVQGREGMDQCPLYVEGAGVNAEGELTLTTDAGDEAVTAIRERASAHVADE